MCDIRMFLIAFWYFKCVLKAKFLMRQTCAFIFHKPLKLYISFKME